ncbi:MAG: 6-bladed beta-propeller [Verrucomicrobia bacterium]|nr:MAG: 6-bladed beta-propeller [Verrucomicrobiota bacterium]
MNTNGHERRGTGVKGRGGQTVNTKHQTPNTREASNLKHQRRPEGLGAWSLVFLWCLVFGVWCLCSSCSGLHRVPSAAAAAAPVWPLAPDQPRIRYVRSIATPADIGSGPGRWKRVVNFFTGETTEEERFAKPFAVALDEAGNLCLADTGKNAVYYFDLAHKKWHRWTAAGKQAFAFPVAVACRKGVFYVADSELGKILAFGEDGREVLTIAAPLQRPAGLAFLGDSLIVADSQAQMVRIFDLAGHQKLQFGKRGLGPGEFNYPTHVGTDSQGHVLVTDSLNSRVQVFDSSGNFVAQIGGPGDAPGSFGRPKGVAADSFGHIYVVDALFDTVQVFDLSGRFLLPWGEGGTRPGQFGVPAGIAISQNNLIYVADSYNRRVQVFEYLGEQ